MSSLLSNIVQTFSQPQIVINVHSLLLKKAKVGKCSNMLSFKICKSMNRSVLGTTK
jgi:NAD/NADP transhydrogenase beta subunit